MAKRPSASFARQPANLSILKPNGFLFVIDKIPTARYFTNSLQLPGLTVSAARQFTNAFSDLWVPGDKMEFDDLLISCQTDEEMYNVDEIYRWIAANTGKTGAQREYSDATLIILDNKENPIGKKFRFHRTFPYMMMALPFDARESADAPLMFDITFKYQYWEIL